MELHPILEKGEIPIKSKTWYVVSAAGSTPPSMRVGHCAISLPRSHSPIDRILVIGGANPSGVFAESHLLNLDAYEWQSPGWSGFKGRYEHAAFVPSTDQDKVFVFGGANETGNLDDIQLLDLESGKWSVLETSGESPCPRTCRGSAWCGDRLYIFSGGEQGADPLADSRLHVFDAVSSSWRQPTTAGTAPAPRHGHVMVALGGKLYVHGGMAGETFYDDLHEYDVESSTWRQVHLSGDAPPGTAAHGAVAFGRKIVIFGGMTSNGASDSTYLLETDTFLWKRIEPNGPPPASRLDHAMCILEMSSHRGPRLEHSDESVDADACTSVANITEDARFVVDGVQRIELSNGKQNSLGSESEQERDFINSELLGNGSYESSDGQLVLHERLSLDNSVEDTVMCLFVHGGMDTGGQIFDDCLVMRLDDL